MATAYKNEVSRSGLMKSPVPIDGSEDIILFIPYSLIATDGAVDVVPYFVKASGSIQLGAPQLAFG
jgi:hypothetical protein